MRASKLRHPLAVLRHKLGKRGIPKGQKEMAALVDCSTVTIQKIENGGLKLSEGLARRIAHETGVSLKCLMVGNPRAPLIGADGKPYTFETFERARLKEATLDDRLGVTIMSIHYYAWVRGILRNALRKGDAELAVYRISAALSEVTEKFGLDCEPDFSDDDPVRVCEKVLPLMERDIVEAANEILNSEPKPLTSKRSSGRAKRTARASNSRPRPAA